MNPNKSEIEYSIAEPDDVPGIIKVQQETWIDTYANESKNITREAVAERVAGFNTPDRVKGYQDTMKTDPTKQTWVAKDAGEIIGFCTALNREDTKEIKAIYVLPSYHGQGIGKKLINLGIEWLGKGEIHLEVADYNQKAMDFYRKLDFAEYAKGPKEIEFSSGGTLTTLLMKRVID